LMRRRLLEHAVQSSAVVMNLARAEVARTARWLIVPTVESMGECP
jgi:hypothetical protein